MESVLMEDKLYVTYGLKDTYCETGNHLFKVVLNPYYFKNAHSCDATIMWPDNTDVKYSLEKWGRKMNFSFFLDNNIPEGAANIELTLKTKKGEVIKNNIRFWIITLR
jgi:hypothetical protein